MQITKSKLKLKVPEGVYLPTIQNQIRENLMRMGVSGLCIDIRYDVRQNVCMVKFIFNNKSYEMMVRNQPDVKANMWAINKRIEYKARLHLLDIEPFEVSVSPYLQLENQSGIYENPELPKAQVRCYIILGLPEYASNNQIEKRYRELVKSFHPDMALSEEAKNEFGKKMAEINFAYTEIKKERGI